MMPRYTFTYTLRPDSYQAGYRVLGTVQRDTIANARSILYYCPSCGVVWSRLQLYREDPGGPTPTTWTAIGRACASCGDGHLLSPSDYIDDMPPALLLNELQTFNPHAENWP